MSDQFARASWHTHFSERTPSILGYDAYRHFALFVPIVMYQNEPHVLFQVRSNGIRQPGEISFPGGKAEKEDRSFAHTAFREMQEEIGVASEKARILGPLDYMVTPFQLIIHPFLGEIDGDAELELNAAEVAEVFTVPLHELRNMTPKEHTIYLEVTPEDNFPYHLIPNGENYSWRTGYVTEQFYEYNGYIIWGLTARILTHALYELTLAEKRMT
ncbi:NUDIX hydrolase [Salisediminibacterium halotolerans]|uniref:8-oxo-dGTP pyrophosphatase MutT, NUDIX family n=1 Tax=Salisediminibacterium halotolerans TaxID=517425 RepID=A0A1H9V9T7_9BACI|nr:CoA pyrophosphatase [Salisediminibacterium haloalkalitolerans]SES18349.1 8-oxo-dGTP pyrophosphatase MutT, NUDIX family [Salisediminibacterium haloalkalitolerans]